MMTKYVNKEEALKRIEALLRASFEEGCPLGEPAIEHVFTAEDDFKSKYLVRSSAFFSIDHLMQYIKSAIEDGESG